MNVFAVKNWSKYSRQFAHDKSALYKYKRIILLSQFTLVGSIIGVIHALEDLVDGLWFMPAMDFTMGMVIFVCYIMNEKGYNRAAKLLLVGFLNVFFFFYSSLAEMELGIFMYYFPWIGLAAVIFEPDEKRERFFFIGLSIVLLITLFATKFDAFGSTQFEAVDIGKSFVINLVSSIIVLVFFVYFMVRTNEDTEKQLLDLAAEVQSKNDSLERTNKELDRFLYSASHDLRSPLMSIKGLVEIIHHETGEATIKSYMKLMNDRIDKLDSFIQDIIDYSRNAKTEVVPEPIDFNKLIEEVTGNFNFLEGAENIVFEKSISLSNLPVLDKGRITIVLNNLISNSIKYHCPNRESKFIKIQVEQIDKIVQIAISDNGQGILKEHLDKIFNMFYRASASSKGSGLGLYIVKEALQKLNGSITVESEFNVGTTFKVSLPVAEHGIE